VRDVWRIGVKKNKLSQGQKVKVLSIIGLYQELSFRQVKLEKGKLLTEKKERRDEIAHMDIYIY
jgi:hypothetical protein